MNSYGKWPFIVGIYHDLPIEMVIFQLAMRVITMSGYHRLQVLCKHHGTDTIQDHQQQATVFISDLLEALRAEMPVLSERLFHLLQQEAPRSRWVMC